MSIRVLKPTLFIDLDNTLIECGSYYIAALDAAANEISGTTGMSLKAAKDLINAIDSASVQGPMGFSRDRFPASFEHAAHLASTLFQGKADYRLGSRCYDIGDSVFHAEYRLYPDVCATLLRLREAGWQLVIRTKGDPKVQEYKIQKHGLRELVDHVFISLTKTAEEFQQYVNEVGADPENSFSIGDSRKDDIEPAIAIGLRSILIDPGSNTEWQKQFGSEHEPTFHAKTFADVPAVLQGVYEAGECLMS